MKLLMSPPSPFARKVRVLLREVDLLDRVAEQQVSTSPLASAPDALAANPLGKIPALLRDDGPALYDSRVITRYLNDLAGAKLYPDSSLYEVLTLEATADAIMEATVAMTYEVRLRPEAQQSDDWIDAQWAKAARAIAAIDARWMSHLHGPLNMAQIAVSCALAYVDLRHGDRDWRDGNDALAAWQATFEARDAMQATKP
ncbi:glutathione S-transferase [Thalassorhabdomicrobium marinisediminis]|uniref:Glutathione S-transferase n=1 Tax=Thalassorhabdomicrobium marinisediminis TaxID=2170577 RepID=A0A2T7G023_9RHOB|nr:glutathione S-transferase [Thalassorhabdomicrobium marinisediminis]PVA07764.1 glutathione S-transferase [Thalassorhabdomicrobium marinisediminis]